MKVTEAIREIRKKRGVTQEKIADVLKCDPSNYSKIETGVQKLTVEDLEKIADYLEEDITYFFTYPKRYVDEDSIKKHDRICVTFEISPDKREHLLKLVTGSDSKIIEEKEI